MPSSLKVGDVQTALAKRLFSSVTTWNRLEGRPRTTSFEESLQAEVRDPLWMLTRQWQMGEFEGSDADPRCLPSCKSTQPRLQKYQPDAQAVQPFEQNVPLEAKVERRPLPFS